MRFLRFSGVPNSEPQHCDEAEQRLTIHFDLRRAVCELSVGPRRLIAGLVAPLLLAPISPGVVYAQGIRSYCASAKQEMARDGDLRAAARAVFPNAGFATRDSDCLYPMKVLRYGDANVLITLAGKPGDACHGCAANLSAYVLRRSSGRSVVVARFVDFTSTGTFGYPGDVDAIQLAGHDAFVIVSGGTFQGYSFSAASFFVFEGGRLVELKPSLSLSADNSGAMTDDRKAVSVAGSWRVDPSHPDAVTITYKVKARGRERSAGVTWTVRGAKLAITSGRVPPEIDTAAGN